MIQDYLNEAVFEDVVLVLLDDKHEYLIKSIPIGREQFDTFEHEWEKIVDSSSGLIEIKQKIFNNPNIKYLRTGFRQTFRPNEAYQNPIRIEFSRQELRFLNNTLPPFWLKQSRFSDNYRKLDEKGFLSSVEFLKNECLKVVKAKTINDIYTFCNSTPNILMYSRNDLGWHGFLHNINTNFQVEVRTNFGYGKSGYFHALIKYKGLTISPYTDLIKYRYTKAYEILKYTRAYNCNFDEWENSFSFVRSASQLAIADERQFINKYVVEEITRFVDGLLDIVYDKIILEKHVEGFALLDRSKPFRDIYYRGHNLFEFKLDRVAESIGFVDNIKQWEPELGELEVDKIIKEVALHLITQVDNQLNVIKDNVVSDIFKLLRISEKLCLPDDQFRKKAIKILQRWRTSQFQLPLSDLLDKDEHQNKYEIHIKMILKKEALDNEIMRQYEVIKNIELRETEINQYYQ